LFDLHGADFTLRKQSPDHQSAKCCLRRL
jgi:hypothetical protein